MHDIVSGPLDFAPVGADGKSQTSERYTGLGMRVYISPTIVLRVSKSSSDLLLRFSTPVRGVSSPLGIVLTMSGFDI